MRVVPCKYELFTYNQQRKYCPYYYYYLATGDGSWPVIGGILLRLLAEYMLAIFVACVCTCIEVCLMA